MDGSEGVDDRAEDLEVAVAEVGIDGWVDGLVERSALREGGFPVRIEGGLICLSHWHQRVHVLLGSEV